MVKCLDEGKPDVGQHSMAENGKFHIHNDLGLCPPGLQKLDTEGFLWRAPAIG